MRKEKGAIVVEATIALTAFIFAIFMILSIVNICFIQAKIGVSLNTAAKEISQYSYLYYAFGVDGLDAKLSEGTEESKKLATDTIDGVGTFMDSLENAAGSAQSGDFDTMISEIEEGTKSADSLISEYAKKLKNDPKGFILGMGKMAANELKEEAKVVLAQILAKTFMQKNLMSGAGDDADAFLKRYKVVDGMDGLDFDYTTFLANGNSNQIQLVVTYDVKVIQLLRMDFNFTIRQCSKTTAWGNGVSLLQPRQSAGSTTSIWDNPDRFERGKAIVAAEKEKYAYTSSGSGFDAYNNSGGANEFISITSLNTHDASYQTANGIKGRLAAAYKTMHNGVKGLDENITVQDKNGQSVTVSSNPESRTYRMVLVVPDDADLSVVAEAVKAFKAANPGVEVSVRQGYGSPSEPEE